MRKVSKIMSLLTVGLMTLVVTGCSDHANERRAAELVKYTERSFLNPISQETALDVIQNDATVNMEIFLPNGSSENVVFEDYSSLWGYDSLTPVDREQTKELEINGWVRDADIQRVFYEKFNAFSSMEEKYGITLSVKDREYLQMPDEIPTTLSRYGTVDLLIAQGDGTFYNGPVTLIWDDSSRSFKLIYGQETSIETELPELPTS